MSIFTSKKFGKFRWKFSWQNLKQKDKDIKVSPLMFEIFWPLCCFRPMVLQCFAAFHRSKRSKTPLQRHWAEWCKDQKISNFLSLRSGLPKITSWLVETMCKLSKTDFCTFALLKALKLNLLYIKIANGWAFRSAEDWNSTRKFSDGLDLRVARTWTIFFEKCIQIGSDPIALFAHSIQQAK